MSNRIPKSAAYIGTIVFNNGNETALYYHRNRNTEEEYIFQKPAEKRSVRRVGGRNLKPLMEEIDHVLCEGEAHWDLNPSDAMIEKMKQIRDSGE